MSSSSVTVLCPNARRQVVKVQANTKVLDILEEVCKRQGLEPNHYDLVHQKKRLDLALAYRLSGVPNHAQLDLVELAAENRRTGRVGSTPVSVCLQLDDGTRLAVREFKPAETSLHTVLDAYAADNDAVKNLIGGGGGGGGDFKRPVVTYVNEQVIGQYQLKNTSLLDLGLLNGRFVLRLGERKIDDDDMEKLDVEFKAKLEKKLRLDEIYSKKLSQEVVENATSKPLTEAVAARTDEQPRQSDYRSSEPEPKQESKKSKIEVEVPRYDYQSSSNIEYTPPSQFNRVNEFENFKFPEETKGMNLQEATNELEAMERESREACDRLPVAFNLMESRRRRQEDDMQIDDDGPTTASASAAAATSSNRNDDEGFFDVTIDDLRSRLHDLQRFLRDDAPLMTREMREMERDKRAMKYAKVAVRVSFKNGIILQGLFRPKEPIAQLYKFVRSCLISEYDFQLFVSPPKKILVDMKQTLFDAGLCPASIVYFKQGINEDPELNPDIKKVSADEANELVVTNVHQAMRNVDHEGFKWMEKENSLVQNILKGSGLRAAPHQQQENRRMVDYEVDEDENRARQQYQDPNRKKLEKFLKGGKK